MQIIFIYNIDRILRALIGQKPMFYVMFIKRAGIFFIWF